MNLPTLTIPDIPLPFEIPAMMHPAIVHFAVALPVIIILLELINLGARRKSIGSISFLLIVLMAIVYLGAYLTGSVDANNAKDALSPETKNLLDAHKNGGVWLVYGALAAVVIKMISAAVNKFPAKVVFLIVMGLFFWGATSVVQKGCALTYKHGVNVKVSTAKAVNTVKENVAKDIEKKAEEVKEEAAKVVEDAKAKTEQAAEKTKETTQKAAETIKEKSSEAVEKAKETTEKAVESVKEKATEVKEAAKKAVESTKEKLDETKKAIEKAIEPAPKTAPATMPAPVETVPAG